MDFFQAHETLTALQWTLRAIVSFLFFTDYDKSYGSKIDFPAEITRFYHRFNPRKHSCTSII